MGYTAQLIYPHRGTLKVRRLCKAKHPARQPTAASRNRGFYTASPYYRTCQEAHTQPSILGRTEHINCRSAFRSNSKSPSLLLCELPDVLGLSCLAALLPRPSIVPVMHQSNQQPIIIGVPSTGQGRPRTRGFEELFRPDTPDQRRTLTSKQHRRFPLRKIRVIPPVR